MAWMGGVLGNRSLHGRVLSEIRQFAWLDDRRSSSFPGHRGSLLFTFSNTKALRLGVRYGPLRSASWTWRNISCHRPAQLLDSARIGICQVALAGSCLHSPFCKVLEPSVPCCFQSTPSPIDLKKQRESSDQCTDGEHRAATDQARQATVGRYQPVNRAVPPPVAAWLLPIALLALFAHTRVTRQAEKRMRRPTSSAPGRW